MRGHDRVESGRDRAPERNQLHRIDARARNGDGGEREVGVLIGVAMPGKVFPGGDHPMLLETAHEGGAERGGECGSSPNDRTPMTGFAGLLLTSSTGANAT